MITNNLEKLAGLIKQERETSFVSRYRSVTSLSHREDAQRAETPIGSCAPLHLKISFIPYLLPG
jgi:hypothetical protein